MSIVYSCKNGGEYTKAAVLQEIQTWANQTGLFSSLTIKDAATALNVIYEIVIAQLTWECPSTLLNQWNEEDMHHLLHCLKEAGVTPRR